VHFDEHVVLAAVAVDEHGDKHVLGLREGRPKMRRLAKRCWQI
jgi:hypothetical protein